MKAKYASDRFRTQTQVSSEWVSKRLEIQCDDKTDGSSETSSSPSPDPSPDEDGYDGQNKRALTWAAIYFLGWILQRLWCHLGLPEHCDLARKPLDVLTDLIVLFVFSLVQSYWCEIILKSRFDDLMKAPWVFVIVLGTPLLVSALGLVDGLEHWQNENDDKDFEFSAIRSTVFCFGLFLAVFLTAWHFARAYLTLPGMQLLSGETTIEKPDLNLFGIYTSSRAMVITWSILFVSFILSDRDGFDYRGTLLAWMLSLIAVFPHFFSYLWLGVLTGIFLQGIGANRLQFL